jgi:hypothetical protein
MVWHCLALKQFYIKNVGPAKIQRIQQKIPGCWTYVQQNENKYQKVCLHGIKTHLPMVFWPPTNGIWSPIPMVYRPPTHGILTPLPLVYRPPYPWYFDSLSMVFWSPIHAMLTYLLIRNEGGQITIQGGGSRYHMTPVLSSFMT